jgi:DNA topoisomerase VI subunit B
MADKRGFVRRNRGLFNCNTAPSHTNKKLKKYILKQPDNEELRRRCGKESETIQHITVACGELAPTEYVKRHDGLAKIIHQKLAETAELIVKFHIISTHQPMYWRKNISSCTRISAYLQTKQYSLIDLI